MSQDILWVQHPTSHTWHGWVRGQPMSACSRMTELSLRKEPARDVRTEIPMDEHDLCFSCVRNLGLATPKITARMWEIMIERRALAARVQLDKEDIEDFADLLCRLGPPGMKGEADEIFKSVTSILLKPVRVALRTRGRGKQAVMKFPHFREAVQLIPPGADNLRHLANAIQTWRAVTGLNPTMERFRSDQVIQTMLSVPSPEAYVQRLTDKGLPHLGVMFHPNTLEQSRKDSALRGIFWTGATESGGFDDLEVIE